MQEIFAAFYSYYFDFTSAISKLLQIDRNKVSAAVGLILGCIMCLILWVNNLEIFGIIIIFIIFIKMNNRILELKRSLSWLWGISIKKNSPLDNAVFYSKQALLYDLLNTLLFSKDPLTGMEITKLQDYIKENISKDLLEEYALNTDDVEDILYYVLRGYNFDKKSGQSAVIGWGHDIPPHQYKLIFEKGVLINIYKEEFRDILD